MLIALHSPGGNPEANRDERVVIDLVAGRLCAGPGLSEGVIGVPAATSRRDVPQVYVLDWRTLADGATPQVYVLYWRALVHILEVRPLYIYYMYSVPQVHVLDWRTLADGAPLARYVEG